MLRVLITAVATLAICVSLSANGADEKAECIGDIVFLYADDHAGKLSEIQWPNIVAGTTAQLSAEKQLNQNPGAPCKQTNKLLKLALP